ncbi:hypothetical protein DFJ73DRAFT_663412, partial [Zopfochytrium polystomum]
MMSRLRVSLMSVGRLVLELFYEANSKLDAIEAAEPHETASGNTNAQDLLAAIESYSCELEDLSSPTLLAARLRTPSRNQAAILSASKTERSVKVLSGMCACLSLLLSQVSETRSGHARFEKVLRIAVREAVRDILTASLEDNALLRENAEEVEKAVELVESSAMDALERNRNLAWADRVDRAAKEAVGVLLLEPSALFPDDCSASVLRQTYRHLSSSLQSIKEGSALGPLLADGVRPFFNQLKMVLIGYAQFEIYVRIFGIYFNRCFTCRAGVTPKLNERLSIVIDFVTDRESLSTVVLSCFRSSRSDKGEDKLYFLCRWRPNRWGTAESGPCASTGSQEIDRQDAQSSPNSPTPTESEAIAIIGIGARLPKGIETLDDAWEMFLSAGDLITAPPRDRSTFRKTDDFRGGFLSREHAETVDGAFFGVSPKEASTMDPKQWLLLETTLSAFEDALIPPDSLKGRSVGVFMCARPDGFEVRLSKLLPQDEKPSLLATGADLALPANRVSYFFDFKGPSITINTACASGGTATDLAVRSLLAGQCEAALIGGSVVMADRSVYLTSKAAGIISAKQGRCATFQTDADGYVPCESAIVLLARRLSDATRDGNRIYAVIDGAAQRHKGREGMGISAPSQHGVAGCIRDVLAVSRWQASDVDFVEAHATGTVQGDQVEALGIADGLREERGRRGRGRRRLLIGAAKSHVGHTEGVAALTAVLKVCLAMQRGVVPPSRVDPARIRDSIADAFGGIGAEVAVAPAPWPSSEKRALVVAGGLGGVVSAIALRSPPATRVPAPSSAVARASIFTISAKSKRALEALTAKYRNWIDGLEEGKLWLASVATNIGRQHYAWRHAAVGNTKSAVVRSLDESKGKQSFQGRTRPLVLVFPGNGSFSGASCMESLQGVEAFLMHMTRCEDVLRVLKLPDAPGEFIKFSLEHPDSTGPYFQVFNFCCMFSAASLLTEVAGAPAIVIGHSFGEVVAATIAGALSLQSAIRLIYYRTAALIQADAFGEMVSVFADLDSVNRALAASGAAADLAVHNGSTHFVVSGASTEIQKVVAECEARSLSSYRLPNEFAYHSRNVQAACEALRTLLVDHPMDGSLRIPLATCLDARIVAQGQSLGAHHWPDHLRQPVRFADAVTAVSRSSPTCIFVEIGDGAMVSLLRRHFGGGSSHAFASFGKDFVSSLALLYSEGFSLNWTSLHGAVPVSSMPSLPLYSHDRVHVWEAAPEAAAAPISALKNSAAADKVAIVGVGLRLPGSIVTLKQLAAQLKKSPPEATELPLDRPDFL